MGSHHTDVKKNVCLRLPSMVKRCDRKQGRVVRVWKRNKSAQCAVSGKDVAISDLYTIPYRWASIGL